MRGFVIFTVMLGILLCGLPSTAAALSAVALAEAPIINSPQAGSSIIHNGQRQGKPVVIVSVPGLSFMELEPEWLAAFPAWNKLFRTGQIGAMNIRSPWKGMESVYATWGAGQWTDGRGGIGWERNERLEGGTAVSLMERYVGSPQGEPGVVVPAIEAMRRGMPGTSTYPGRAGSDPCLRNRVYGLVHGESGPAGIRRDDAPASGLFDGDG
ncbi:hypothetical protein LJK88_03360 [Paenibacillus sp. P26]|nr:hypothetical protein LJK88_03360 [Paenibacillus sp. P26]